MPNDDFDPKYIGFLILFAFFIALIVLLVTQWHSEAFREVVIKQMVVFVVLPAAALFSIVLIALFQATSGNIKFEAIGFKFEGASGPIVMWCLCMVTIMLGIKVFWIP